MLEKCATCGSRIVGGAANFEKWSFCSEECGVSFLARLAEEIVPAEEIEREIAAIFQSPCPQCGKPGGTDLHSTVKLTGMVVVYQIKTETVLCCAACGRWNRIKAALYCFAFGWWSIRSAFFNLFIIPTNLIACAFTLKQAEPSAALAKKIKVQLFDRYWHDSSVRLKFSD